MLLTHVSNFVHKSPKMTKVFRRFREEIAPVWVKTVVVFGLSIFIKSLIYQLSSLVLEIFFQWVVILKFLILFCVWSIYVFSTPFLKKVYLNLIQVYKTFPKNGHGLSRFFYWESLENLKNAASCFGDIGNGTLSLRRESALKLGVKRTSIFVWS